MTRIVGGHWAGRSLITPRGSATRPTSEKIRGAIANALAARAAIEGAAVLDLFAGSGALGLELASRGATRVTFVDMARSARHAIRANIAALLQRRDTSYDTHQPPSPPQRSSPPQPHSQPPPQLTLAPVTATAFARSGSDTFDIVVADPPYDLPLAEVTAIFAQLWESQMIAPDADLIVEHATRSGELMWPEPLIGDRVRRYGDTMISYGHAP